MLLSKIEIPTAENSIFGFFNLRILLSILSAELMLFK